MSRAPYATRHLQYVDARLASRFRSWRLERPRGTPRWWNLRGRASSFMALFRRRSKSAGSLAGTRGMRLVAVAERSYPLPPLAHEPFMPGCVVLRRWRHLP